MRAFFIAAKNGGIALRTIAACTRHRIRLRVANARQFLI
jgi:hypothetical protein